MSSTTPAQSSLRSFLSQAWPRCRAARLLFVLAVSQFAHAQEAGVLDTSWNVAVGMDSASWSAIATQADGKVLVGAAPFIIDGSLQVTRFTAAGIPDAAFGSAGTARLPVATAVHRVDEVKVDALGRIYVAARASNIACPQLPQIQRIVTRGFAIARLLPDGRPDPAFGAGTGYIFLPLDHDRTSDAACNVGAPLPTELIFRDYFSSSAGTWGVPDTIKGLALQHDGKLLLLSDGEEIGAGPRARSVVVWRFEADGRSDTSFGTAGLALFPLREFGAATAIAATNDGTIVIAGQEAAPLFEAFVLKLTAQGRLDPGFAGSGKFNLRSGQYNFAVGDLALQADAKIVVAGARTTNPTAEWDPMVFRLNANGTLDDGFSFLGVGIHDISPLSTMTNSIAVDPSGNLLVGATIAAAAQQRQAVLLQLAPNGTLDFTRALELRSAVESHESLDLEVREAAYLLTWERAGFQVRKFSIAPPPRGGSLSTGTAAASAGFRVDMRNMSGNLVSIAPAARLLGIHAYVYPQAADVDALADLFVVAVSPRGWYMRNTSGAFVPWSTRLGELVPALEDVRLTGSVHVPVHGGQLPMTGTYQVYVGYMRTDGGPLLYSAAPKTLVSTP